MKFNEGVWDTLAFDAKNRGTPGGAILTNFHLRRVTSSYLANYSHFQAGNAESRCGLGAKLGLQIDKKFVAGRYIIGGWCIGTVLDSAASRASIGNQIRTAPATMALNVNVNIEWWSSDKLYRHYMDVDGSVRTRAEAQRPTNLKPVNATEERTARKPVNAAEERTAGQAPSNMNLSEAVAHFGLNDDEAKEIMAFIGESDLKDDMAMEVDS